MLDNFVTLGVTKVACYICVAWVEDTGHLSMTTRAEVVLA
jgi:hypothetical protein